MSSAQRKPAQTENSVEQWLRETVVPALDAYKAGSARTRTPEQVSERLGREIARRR